MDKDQKQLIALLKANKVIQFGKFILSSGIESDYYVDMKKAITDPKILLCVSKIIVDKIKDEKIDRIAGPALGAVPIATAVSLHSGIPMLMIRKSKKGYGTSKQVEGELQENDKVIVVDDVTTTGNSLIKAIEAVFDNGGNISRAFVVVDREEGAKNNLKSHGVILEALVSIKDFK